MTQVKRKDFITNAIHGNDVIHHRISMLFCLASIKSKELFTEIPPTTF
jgi:hypothetical protein